MTSRYVVVMLRIAPPDGSRDPRIEDPTNLYLVHPLGRMLLPWFVARGISANAVSVGGLVMGAGAAFSYAHWSDWRFAVLGLVLSVAWLVADGLDGMIARATGTASALGRALDGLCDHGVFALIYIVLAASIGTVSGWLLAVAAGVAHAVQSNLYEGERARFHRRLRGVPPVVPAPSRNPLVRLYDGVSNAVDARARRIDQGIARAADADALAVAYGAAAAPPLHFMSLLSANVRVGAIFVACAFGAPAAFWWFELVPLTIILIAGLAWHQSVAIRLVRRHAPADDTLSNRTLPLTKDLPRR